MITECVLGASALFLYNNRDKLNIRLKWNKICKSKSTFTNNLEKTLKIWSIRRTEYGYIIRIELPYSYTKEDLEKDMDIFKEGLKFKSIQLKQEGNIVDMYCVKNYKFKDYRPLYLPGNKLLVGDGLTEDIIVDMNKFPHMLIGGDTGTGKSRVLLLILTNLIKYCDNIEIHLLQIRKNDLGVFVNCKQVKSNSKTLEEVRDTLKSIDKECFRREKLIDNTKGYYNIEDYNKVAYYKLKYVYAVIEEFSFLNASRGDTKNDKRLKNECLKYVKNIINVGRSSGVFLITALQKPTNDSIPSDIKAQLCTRISLRIEDSPAAIVIMGDGSPTKLGERELICKTLGTQQGYSYTIGHDIIMEHIKDKIIKKENKKEDKGNIIVAPEESNVRSILDKLNAIN